MNHKFFISYTSCDKIVWGVGRTAALAQVDCMTNLELWDKNYKNNYLNTKIETIPCSKKFYDIICQYGFMEERHKWNINDQGIADFIR